MKSTLLTCAALCALSGCATSLIEERVITQFVDALEEENVTAMRRVVSTEFEQKALRSEDVLRDLDIIDLPKGELEILDVDDSAADKRVVVVSDASGSKYKFELVQDPEKQRWAVNDVLVRQKKKWKKTRSSVTWPTSQVLDLVFSVREYMDDWSASKRSQILARSSPALAASLESVPEAWLPVITNQVASNYDPAMARKPEASLKADAAVVRMPVRGGFLLVSAVLVDNRWLMDDIEIHSRSNSGHPGSVRRQADSVGSLARFLTAFASRDKELLQASSSPNFYQGTLQFADLNLVSLPVPQVAPTELSIRAFSGRVTIVVPTERDFVRFDLLDPDYKAEKHIARDGAPRQFLVDDVKLTDRTRDSERTLASVFTAPTRASLFFESLQSRDVDMLKQLSTREFSAAIWQRTSSEMLHSLTIPVTQLRGLTLQDTDVRGKRTELTFSTTQGTLVKCRMLEQVGRLLVDDVQYAETGDQMVSLRQQTALQLPIAEFTKAWRASDLELLKESCSTGFDRLVLSNFTTFPPDTAHLADRLDTALRSMRVTDERATVHMGLASRDTAEVHLVQEEGRWLIDDISIPGGEGNVRVRSQLRQHVVNNMRMNTTDPAPIRRTNPAVQPVESQPRRPQPVPVIQQAGGIQQEPDSVINVPYEVFGPGSADVSRKLQEQPQMVAAPSASADKPDPSTALAPADSQPRLKPVPGEPVDSKDFLVFGPGASAVGVKSIPATSPAAAATPVKPVRKTTDLSMNPVSID